MDTLAEPMKVGSCNNTALRKAARRVTRFYDASMAETGLRGTQYVILNLLATHGPSTMTELADLLAMDRATIGHNLRPLERDGFLMIQVGRKDRREREVVLSSSGVSKEAQCKPFWESAQARFEELFGEEDALAMRRILGRVTRLELELEQAESAGRV